MSADDYNEDELAAGRIKPAHVSEMTALVQASFGLPVDGKCGPATRALLESRRSGRPVAMQTPPDGLDLSINESGWLSGANVVVMPIHRSWYYPRLSTLNGRPEAIVAHYTATDPGTARAMARKRATPCRNGVDRAASWHVSIETSGVIIQMAPFTAGGWHAGGATAKPIPRIGPANRTAVGVELVGHGDAFPSVQVDAARRVWRALVRTYDIPRAVAMVTHQELDPTRKRDPGTVWMSRHAPDVLTYAYADA